MNKRSQSYRREEAKSGARRGCEERRKMKRRRTEALEENKTVE
jgi:hypothetical protein